MDTLEYIQNLAKNLNSTDIILQTNIEVLDTNTSELVENKSLLIALAEETDNLISLANVSVELNSLANVSVELNSLASISSNLISLSGNVTELNSLASISSNLESLSGVSSNLISLSGNVTELNSLASISSNLESLSGVSSDLVSLSGNVNEINEVASRSNFLSGNVYSNLDGIDNVSVFNQISIPEIYCGMITNSVGSGTIANIYLPSGYIINSFNITSNTNVNSSNIYVDVMDGNILNISTDTTFDGKISYFIMASH